MKLSIGKLIVCLFCFLVILVIIFVLHVNQILDDKGKETNLDKTEVTIVESVNYLV